MVTRRHFFSGLLVGSGGVLLAQRIRPEPGTPERSVRSVILQLTLLRDDWQAENVSAVSIRLSQPENAVTGHSECLSRSSGAEDISSTLLRADSYPVHRGFTMGFLDANNSSQVVNYNGGTLANAKLYAYAAGTEKLARVFQDKDLTTMRANPMTADDSGRFDICYLVNGDYRLVITTARGQVIMDEDNVPVSSTFANGVTRAFHEFSDLTADKTLSYQRGVGLQKVRPQDLIQVHRSGVNYEVAEADATDYQAITARGVKLYQLAVVLTDPTLADLVARRGLQQGAIYAAGTSSYIFAEAGTYPENGMTVVNTTGIPGQLVLQPDQALASEEDWSADTRPAAFFPDGQVIQIGSSRGVVNSQAEPGSYRENGSADPARLVVLPDGGRRVSLSAFGCKGTGNENDSENFLIACMSGLPLSGTPGATYALGTGIVIQDTMVDIDLNGATILNTSATDRAIIADYPYGTPMTVTAVDLAARKVTVASTAGLYKGQRLKIVSGDRCPGMRPVEVNGKDYWQAQILTIAALTATEITFREPFEEDFTFATQPKVMTVNPKSFKIRNGRMSSEKGYAGTRTNGLIRVRGGTGHHVEIDVDNSNNTAIEFHGCDGCRYVFGTIREVGQTTNTSANHGISFIACNSPYVGASNFSRCRHSMTTNDTATYFADDNFYVMGPSYDLKVHGCTVEGDTAAAFSTHHGVRRASFDMCTAIGSPYGFGIRGRDVSVTNSVVEGCETSVFYYSEADIAAVDQTTRGWIDGLRTIGAGAADLQVQRCSTVVLGDNIWQGSAPRGAFLNINAEVIFQGSNFFRSDATFNASDNFLQIISTDVKIHGTLTLSIPGMAINGSNYAIYSSGEFICDGTILADIPGGAADVHRHLGNGDVAVENLLFSGKNGNPTSYVSSSPARVKYRSRDGATSSAWQSKTASAAYELGLQGALDPQITANLLIQNGSYSLASIDDGSFAGQRLLVRAYDSTDTQTFTLLSSISNLDLRGGDLTMHNNDMYAFVWTGSLWVIETRSA